NNAGSGYDVLGKFWVGGIKQELRTTEWNVVTDGKGGIKASPADVYDKLEKECCDKCIREHEETQIQDIMKQNPNIGKAPSGKPLDEGILILWTNAGEQADTELKAFRVEKTCLEEENKTASKKCAGQIDRRNKFVVDREIERNTKRKKDYDDAMTDWREKMGKWDPKRGKAPPEPGLNPQANSPNAHAINGGPPQP
ncbi:MAG: hypothetical protein WCH43_15540, partial [Verrucomicrobiota bacterium]